jgi:hypothetical protein
MAVAVHYGAVPEAIFHAEQGSKPAYTAGASRQA